jgi:hypothetical protein
MKTKEKYTARQVRMAQDLAVELDHLNKGIPSLIDMYAAAPTMKAELNGAACTMESVAANIRAELERKREPFGGSTWSILSMVEKDAARLRAAVAQAEGKI